MHPSLFHLGSLYVPAFGVLAALGLMAALGLSLRTARLTGVDPDALWDAGVFAILGAYGLSRLLLAATLWHTLHGVSWILLVIPSFTAGDLALTVAATLLWLRIHRIPELRALDAWAPCVALAWMFLGLGQLAARPEVAARAGREAPYEACLAALLATLSLARLGPQRRPGETAGGVLLLSGAAQFLLTLSRPALDARWLGLEPGEWLALTAVALGGILIAFAPRPPATDEPESQTRESDVPAPTAAPPAG